jgi:hypothetical protein
LRRLEREARVEQFLLQLRIGEIHNDGVRRDLGSGQDANAHHGGVGLGRDQFDRILARRENAGRRAHLAHQRAAFHGVGPDGRAIHLGRGRFQAHDDRGQRRNGHHRDARPDQHLALLFSLNVGPSDIHRRRW